MIGHSGGVAFVQPQPLSRAKEEEMRTPRGVGQYSVLNGFKYLASGPGSFGKRFFFCVSLIFTSARRNFWWTQIAEKQGAKLILGAIPLAEHKREIKKLGVRSFLTLLEPHERVHSLVMPLFAEPKSEFGQKIIEAEDVRPLSSEQIQQGVDYIRGELEAGRSVYVHCKAGVGRSASVVLSYLMLEAVKNGTPYRDVKEAYRALKKLRPQVNLNKRQLRAVEEWYAAQPEVIAQAAAKAEIEGLRGESLRMPEAVQRQLSVDLDRQLFQVGSEGKAKRYTGDTKVTDFKSALRVINGGEELDPKLFEHIAICSQQAGLSTPMSAAVQEFFPNGLSVSDIPGEMQQIRITKEKDGTWTVTQSRKLCLRKMEGGGLAPSTVILETEMRLSATGEPLGFRSSFQKIDDPAITA